MPPRPTVNGRPLYGRAAVVARDVWARGYVWEAYDQGRLAHALGRDQALNPFTRGHVYHADFDRGWNDEAAHGRLPLDIPAVRQALEAHRDAIGVHRDALRDLAGEISALGDTTRDAFESLDAAIGSLSELA